MDTTETQVLGKRHVQHDGSEVDDDGGGVPQQASAKRFKSSGSIFSVHGPTTRYNELRRPIRRFNNQPGTSIHNYGFDMQNPPNVAALSQMRLFDGRRFGDMTNANAANRLVAGVLFPGLSAPQMENRGSQIPMNIVTSTRIVFTVAMLGASQWIARGGDVVFPSPEITGLQSQKLKQTAVTVLTPAALNQRLRTAAIDAREVTANTAAEVDENTRIARRQYLGIDADSFTMIMQQYCSRRHAIIQQAGSVNKLQGSVFFLQASFVHDGIQTICTNYWADYRLIPGYEVGFVWMPVRRSLSYDQLGERYKEYEWIYQLVPWVNPRERWFEQQVRDGFWIGTRRFDIKWHPIGYVMHSPCASKQIRPVLYSRDLIDVKKTTIQLQRWNDASLANREWPQLYTPYTTNFVAPLTGHEDYINDREAAGTVELILRMRL